MRPYEQVLEMASNEGIVLKRTDIYGSGPPVDQLSHDAQKLVAVHCVGSVIDFGAGCGVVQKYIGAAYKEQYLGIEINPQGVEMAEQRGRNVVHGNVLESGLADRSYDVCTMLEVLEHIDDYEGALREAHRVCRSHLAMTVPNIAVIPEMSARQVVPWHLLEATHVNFFTPRSLAKVLQRFFTRVEVWEINPWFSPGLHMNIAAVAWR